MIDTIKRCIVCAVGCIFTGAGVAAFYATNLGSDPISLWCDGLHNILGVSYGQASFINTSFWVVLLLIFYRKHINFGTIITWTTMSIWIDVFGTAIDTMAPASSRGMVLRVILLAAGMILLAIGISIQHCAAIGCSGAEAAVLSLRDFIDKPYKYVRMAWDAVFAVLGVVLGGVVGVGTVVGVLMTGPMVSATDKFMKGHILPLIRISPKRKTLKEWEREKLKATEEKETINV